MSRRWFAYCRGDRGIMVDGEGVVVQFDDGRSHRVAVVETEDSFEFSALVAHRRHINSLESLEQQVWRRNRHAKLHGFRLDNRRKLVAFGWVPRAGLTSAEFRHVLRRVAVEADRWELQLTGKDVE